MRARRYVPAVAAVLACVAAPLACADIFTWIDAKGQLNIGNLEPPDGARITRIVRETPPHANPYNDAARDAAQQAELDSLNQRVAQLQSQLMYAAQQPPPPPQVVVVPQPMPVPMPVPMPYIAAPAPAPQPAGCGYDGWSGWSGWNGCDAWLGFLPYTTYVYVPPLRFRPPIGRGNFPGRGGDHVAPRPSPSRPPAPMSVAFTRR